MRPVSLPAWNIFRRAALALILAALTAAPARAQSTPTWGAPAGTEPCAAADRLERALADDPGLAARRELFETMVREAQRMGIAPMQVQVAGPSYVIPIVVHIVHQNGPENITDAQVLSQVWALNRDFANSPGGPAPAVNAGIQFCLATQLPPGSPVVWSTTPGITRTVSAQTVHTYGSPASEQALKAIDYLPSAKYLNVWVVNTIVGGGGGVAGYATFPGAVPAGLDGIVIRYTAFGSDNTPYGGPYPNLLPNNNDGKIMTHEVGHWLNLLHTFQGGCAAPGDQVADTPPEAVNRSGCPVGSLTSCTNVNDPVENFMDYTDDACRFAFTAEQTTRMQTAIAYFRSTLVGAQNLIDVGCPSGLNALILASRGQICPPDTVTFTTPAAGPGWTYAWSFPGGTPASASTQSAVVSYASPGVYPATLTVTDGGASSSTNSAQVNARVCTPILGPCTNWVLPDSVGISWATGAPVSVAGRSVAGPEASAAVSDGAGAMLFYADGPRVLNRNNAVMPNGTGLLAGNSSHNGNLILPRPGTANQYFLFTVRQSEDYGTPSPMNYSLVDMTLNGGYGDVVAGQKNLLVALPGSPNQLIEGMAAIPHSNGVDWWIVTNGANSGSGMIYVTLVTNAGPVSTTAYNIGIAAGTWVPGGLTASNDGTRVAVGTIDGGNYPLTGQVAVYNFNRASGFASTLLAPTGTWGGYTDVCFSPNGKLLYFNNYNVVSGARILKQLQIATLQVRDIISGPWADVRQGPDRLLYVSVPGATALHCIFSPDSFNTANANECGLSMNSVPLPAGRSVGVFATLPNMPMQCTAALPADFTSTITNCLTGNFTSPNCSGPWTWNFGDLGTGSGAAVSHTYATPGTYTVTLTVPGASPATKVLAITVGLQPVTIAGSSTLCDTTRYNYSAIGPATYTYAWTVSGGAPASWIGNNVDVVWTPGGGTITLVATDPATGCTAMLVKNVGPCPSCLPPPLNMSAWYPLDEPAGTQATEILLGANGTDVNGPLHDPARVRRGRTFNGLNQYVQASDAPGLDFGAGDITVDAWVRTTTASGIAPIVDKRTADPEQGYALYLKNGRLAFRLANTALPTGVEYWSPTAAFVADGQWHHVAGVLRRSAPTDGTRLYVDGVLVASFPAFAGGSVTTTEKLFIGAQVGFFGPAGYMNGSIDEVELFQRSLETADVNGLYLADSLGKCKEFSWVPTVASLCYFDTEATLTMQVCNYTGAAQSYNVGFAGLPAGGACTWAGPTGFTQLTPNPIVVPANGCVPVQYKVSRPAGMPAGTTSCYLVTVTNTGTMVATVNEGSLFATRAWCGGIALGPIGVGGPGGPATVALRVTNTSSGTATTPYSIHLAARTGADPTEDPLVSLNGLTPGSDIHGDLALSPGESRDLAVSATFTEPRAFRYYDIVLSLDDDGDGVLEPVLTAGVTYGQTGSTLAVPPGERVPATLQLGIAPNPVRTQSTIRYALPARGRVELALFDVAGRQVRSVPPFLAEAGPGTLALDCHGLARGVYFVRMRVNGQAAGQRFMLLE